MFRAVGLSLYTRTPVYIRGAPLYLNFHAGRRKSTYSVLLVVTSASYTGYPEKKVYDPEKPQKKVVRPKRRFY